MHRSHTDPLRSGSAVVPSPGEPTARAAKAPAGVTTPAVTVAGLPHGPRGDSHRRPAIVKAGVDQVGQRGAPFVVSRVMAARADGVRGRLILGFVNTCSSRPLLTTAFFGLLLELLALL